MKSITPSFGSRTRIGRRPWDRRSGSHRISADTNSHLAEEKHMSVGRNRTQIIGYVGADPRANDDQSVTRFSVAVTERWKDRSGEDCEHTEWYRVVAFNGLAGVCARSLARGRKVFVEGRLHTRGYVGKDGGEK